MDMEISACKKQVRVLYFLDASCPIFNYPEQVIPKLGSLLISCRGRAGRQLRYGANQRPGPIGGGGRNSSSLNIMGSTDRQYNCTGRLEIAVQGCHIL